jgi:hypothetical protein
LRIPQLYEAGGFVGGMCFLWLREALLSGGVERINMTCANGYASLSFFSPAPAPTAASTLGRMGHVFHGEPDGDAWRRAKL